MKNGIVKHLIQYSNNKHAGSLLAALIVLVLICISLIRLYPFQNELAPILNDAGNDWSYYAQRALDIKHNGLLMPSLKCPFPLPSGFLYCYFLALCFLFFGENTVPAFLIQNIMLGLSISLIYFTFRNKLSQRTGLLFLLALFIFSVLDVYKYYSFRFLSENLALFIISAFFFFFVRGFEKNKFSLQLISAFLMGLAILSRPNMILFGILLIFLVMPYYFKKRKAGILCFTLFISVLIFTTSLLAFRNYSICDRFFFIPEGASTSRPDILGIGNPIPASVDLSLIKTRPFYVNLHVNNYLAGFCEYMVQKPLLFFGHYVKKVLFCFGFLRCLDPAYRWRPHWNLMWLGYFVYLFMRWRERERFEMWEIAVNVYILSYYGLLVLISQLQNYGFRIVIPAVPFVLLLSFKALDKIKLPRIKSS